MSVQTAAPRARHSPFRIPVWLGFCAFAAIAVFLLWQEHRAHLLGALPWILLLLCPVIHVLMHRGHGGHGAAASADRGHAGRRPGEGGLP